MNSKKIDEVIVDVFNEEVGHIDDNINHSNPENVNNFLEDDVSAVGYKGDIDLFLAEEEPKEKEIVWSKDIPSCVDSDGCALVKEFLGNYPDYFSVFRAAQQDFYSEIYQCQNRIERYKENILLEIKEIGLYKEKLDLAFKEYLEK